MNSIKGTGEIYSVSQLNSEVKSVIEGNFPMVWVEGEISNLAQPASGHIYFSLKDARSQVRCAMFRMRRSMLNFQPESGMQVMIYARVGLYEGRGEYQLVAERMEPSGEGALQLAFEQLKAKLDKEGLFDPAIKRPLPVFPKTVGIVTSPTGAAIKDILSVLNRRFPGLEVIIYPTLVQGESASHSIARMIFLATERQECDVLIVTRGGGSLEDLWSFNEEVVARAIVDCDIPVVSGVGHEIDFTIADFVADMRAPTPSAAAELISQDQEKIRQNVESYESWMYDQLQQKLKQLNQRVAWNEKRLVDPRRRLEDLAQRLDDLIVRMNASMRGNIDQRRVEISHLMGDLKQYSPDKVIALNTERCQQYTVRMKSAMQYQLEKLRSKLGEAGRTLNTVSPLATLDRGYSIVKTEKEQVVQSIKDVNKGDQVTARLAVGTLKCTVDECIEPK